MNLRRKIRQIIAASNRREIRIVPVPHLTDNAGLLKGRTALITGAAGGIGRAIAKAFVSAGAKVILAGRTERDLSDLAIEIGDAASILLLDLSRPETFLAALSGIADYPDILVNSGGVLSETPFGDITIAEYERVMDTNVKGMLFLSQEVSNRWKQVGIKGNILNISSGSQYKPGWTVYQVSKNAVDALTRGMASFLIDHGVVVNAIAPGPVATTMLGIDAADLSFPYNPTKRVVTPEEVAQWCLYLVSDLGRYAVGSTFALTGGNAFFQWERQTKFRPK
ncbi:3-oxoacyl-[acyl-carrier-protein] reductase FabG [Mycobacterium sp. THAF192]|nr:3-oxoacyl-[acyl-carrier-protein] reductase FabG [Mycobacterium sp. THAF192]